MDNAKIEHNKPVNYKLTFFGNVIQIKDLIGEDELKDLNWLDNFNHDYNGAQVKTGLTNGLDFTVDSVLYENAVIYPLISYQRQWYYNSDNLNTTNTDTLVNIASNTASSAGGVISGNLKPAIKLNLIIEAIKQKYGFDFNSPFFDGVNFNQIYVNLNKKTETLDNGFISVENVSGSYQSPSVFNYLKYIYRTTITPASGFENTPYKIRLSVNGNVAYESSNFLQGAQTRQTSPVNYEENYTAKLEIITEQSFDFDATTTFQSQFFSLGFDLTIDTIFSNSYTSQSISLSTIIRNELPEIKVYDFLIDIFKTFNLVATSDNETIYINDLQSWLQEGEIYDVTRWIDLKTEKIARGKIYKNISYTFEDSDQILAEQFKLSNQRTYGELELNLSELDGLSDIDGETLKIKTLFENPIHERLFDLNDNSETNIQYTPYFNRETKPISGNMFMFYAIRQNISSNGINFINDGVKEPINTFIYMPSNSRLINQDSFNLNFNAEINTYSSLILQDTIYQRYWSDYIGDMFSKKRRIYSFDAIFPDYFLNQLKLNDRLIIKDRRYIINKISSDLTHRKDKLELINDIYDAPLKSDILNRSIFLENVNVYPSVPATYDNTYIGIDGANVTIVDLGDGTGFLANVKKKTENEVDVITFELAENTSTNSRKIGIRVDDSINNPTFFIFQEGAIVSADSTTITADNNIITVDNG